MSKHYAHFIGFILQFVNVKIYLFEITALTGYVLPYHSSFGMLIFFSMLISTIGSIATISWAVFGAIIQRVYIRYFKVINVILALILLEWLIVWYLNKLGKGIIH